jgi:hypothetical protein
MMRNISDLHIPMLVRWSHQQYPLPIRLAEPKPTKADIDVLDKLAVKVYYDKPSEAWWAIAMPRTFTPEGCVIWDGKVQINAWQEAAR